ncbi:hypothetical protein TIFTF001_015566 [Ficus carica]|uniref:RING-type E3 ubiquitin transferase n=1 Tax=Ficus carica TaxID=3494 RepID=A0AA88A7F7_FICCA|nr:hypothetical protein TIFTF001_015566 [Ficus carica]
MPVVTESVELRRPRSQFAQLISETDPNPPQAQQIPSIIQSTRSKSTISSLLLSTFSNTNTNTNNNNNNINSNETVLPMNNNNNNNVKKKNNFSSATFRGLGCSAGSSQQVSVPAVIRMSADWEEGKKVRKKQKQKHKQKQKKNISKDGGGGGGGKDRNTLLDGVDFQDVWCGPGIGFSADAAASVDCVVARRNGSGSRGKIDGEKLSGHRERSCLARRTVIPEPTSFFDTEPDFLSERSASEDFGARYFRHVRHPSPEGIAEELLELGERIGYVNTGLKEDEIGRCIRKSKPSISNEWSRISSVQADRKCSICQEEYEANDDIGKLDCGHGFHIECIKHWLAHKNTCPVCKAEAVAGR